MSQKGENIYRRNDGGWEEVTFSKIAKDWLLSVKPRIKDSSLAKYRNLISSYIIPYFGEELVDKMTTERIEEFCATLLSCGGREKRGLSPKTTADTLSVIRSILQYAARKHYHPGCDGRGISIKQDSRTICVLSRQNQTQLIEYLNAHQSFKNLGIFLCLFTGVRIGELCALKWEDISFKEKTLYVHNTLQRIQVQSKEDKKTKIVITAPKSVCSIRRIPIPDVIVEVLESFPGSHCGYILTGDEDKFLEPRTMEKHFKKVLENSHVDYVNFHALRHTFATRCIEVGFDVKSLSEILGHANTTITMNRYVHPSMELKRENMQKLSCFL